MDDAVAQGDAGQIGAGARPRAARPLFVATILLGSVLLFLIQPLVARLALPLLGGAPNVWNSAMLVYQALLLGGYAYAHGLARLRPERQAPIHIALLVVAGLTLPIALADLPPPAPGWEAVWVPALFLASVGPVFVLVAAQAPLMQRWYASGAGGDDPYALYAASNFGSFGGLVAYPLLLEPNLPVGAQSWLWTGGYALLIVAVAATALARRSAGQAAGPATAAAEPAPAAEDTAPLGWQRIALWLALAAVPSGLMLSTTTHLTTDIFAMPLLWVIPLGIYLLSYVAAFARHRAVAAICVRVAPFILLLAGGMAAVAQSGATLTVTLAEIVMLFVVATALHTRLHRLRPEPARLTLFYLVTAAGGALGGLFTALLAPLVFDWVWEHPLLVVAAAALIPQAPWLDWMERFDLPGRTIGAIAAAIVTVACLLAWWMEELVVWQRDPLIVVLLMVAVAWCGILVLGRRLAFTLVMAAMIVGRGGWQTYQLGETGWRTRSYFGVYSVQDYPGGERLLTSGSTLHGKQLLEPGRERALTTYYGRTSGVGLVLDHAGDVFGPAAQVAVVGLGSGTLACYRRPGQDFTFFEIDPAMLAFSREGIFTFLANCAPDARVVLGDARLKLAQEPARRFDVIAVDAFSSDAIPLHLLTREALDTYARALKPGGVILFHISNRFVDLRPVLGALAQARGWQAVVRFDEPPGDGPTGASDWVAFAATPATLARVQAASGADGWEPLPPADARPWTDRFASVLPHIRWQYVFGT